MSPWSNMSPANQRAAIIAGLVAVPVYLLGAYMGHDDPHTKYKIEHVTDTKTVTTHDTREVALPACIKLASIADQMVTAASTIDNTNPAVLDIMSELRFAIVDGDMNATNDLETRLRKLDSANLHALSLLSQLKYDYDQLVDDCK